MHWKKHYAVLVAQKSTNCIMPLKGFTIYLFISNTCSKLTQKLAKISCNCSTHTVCAARKRAPFGMHLSALRWSACCSSTATGYKNVLWFKFMKKHFLRLV